jgi:hypothetical protein
MNKKRAILILFMILVLSSFILSFVQTESFSAYGACRDLALKTKGYAIWKHQSAIPLVFMSQVTFSDGYNDLNCSAAGIGPFWQVTSFIKTNAACSLSLSNPPDLCPEDYFEVEP